MSHSLLNSAPNFDAMFAFGLVLLALSASAVPLNGHPLNLQRARISSGYRRTLDGAYDKLTLWCVVHGRPLPHTLENNLQALNTLLVDHLQFLYDEKYGVSAGRHALLAVQTRMRSVRGRLTESWDSMRSWEMLAPVKLRTPMPYIVLQAMFAFAMVTGFNSTGRAARDWISFGVGLICSFDGLLRPCEWAQLSARKSLMPSSRLQHLVGRGLLTISNGKNRRIFGRIQIAMVDCERVIAWLTWLTAGMASHARLQPGGTATFRRLFKTCIQALGLEGLGLTPASLRAGGATWRFASGMDLGHLKWWGRWGSLGTLEHYVQEAAATMVVMELSDVTLQRLEAIRDSSSIFAAPPQRPWSAFFSRHTQRPVRQWTSTVLPKRSARQRQ